MRLKVFEIMAEADKSVTRREKVKKKKQVPPTILQDGFCFFALLITNQYSNLSYEQEKENK